MSALPSQSSAPSPQPSPTRGEGALLLDLANEFLLPLKVDSWEADQIRNETHQSPPRPLWERVGERGC
jgi:hypothetical protein